MPADILATYSISPPSILAWHSEILFFASSALRSIFSLASLAFSSILVFKASCFSFKAFNFFESVTASSFLSNASLRFEAFSSIEAFSFSYPSKTVFR